MLRCQEVTGPSNAETKMLRIPDAGPRNEATGRNPPNYPIDPACTVSLVSEDPLRGALKVLQPYLTLYTNPRATSEIQTPSSVYVPCIISM